MKKKVFWMSVLLLVAGFVLSACGTGGLFKPKVALVLARGGLGDKAFNDSANAGLQRAASELGAETKTFEFQGNDQDQADMLRQIAQQSYDPIIAIGGENSAAIKMVAPDYPKLNFVLIDSTADGDNVTSVIFNELDGDFLAGALAALMSPSGKVGYLGGGNVPVIQRIRHGFEQGVKHVNPKAQIEVRLISDKPGDFSGFARADIGERLGTRMYEAGNDVIYVAAGGSGLGTIEAAKKAGKLLITTGSDQRWLAPEVIVTSRTKNMDSAVFSAIQQFMKGSLPIGVITLDYKSGAIRLAPLNEKLVSAEILAKFEKIRADLEAGKITVKPFTGQ